MRYMIIVRATAMSEAGIFPEDPGLMAGMAAFHEDLAKAGVLLDAAGLQPSAKGWRVRHGSGRPVVVDGPFAETKEMLAGFYLIDAPDLNAAIQIAAGIPPARHGSIEVRPVRQLQTGPV